jgi:hypothetical protein
MNKNRRLIPNLSDNVNENIELILSQAEQTSNGARNKVEDLFKLTDDFLKTLYNDATKEYVFWKITDEYIGKKYYRPNHLLYLCKQLEPKYFIVYQLLKDGEIVYIGKTSNIHKRLASHIKNKDFNNVLLFKCPDETYQSVLEQTLIEKYRPPLNKSLNLNLIDPSLTLPHFQNILDFNLDFFTPSNMAMRLPANNHVWINIGFVSKDKLRNTPHWLNNP